MRLIARDAAFAILCLATTGCSTVMEAERPQATNLGEFLPGERRFDVIARIGPPLSTIEESGNSCDVYKMHTKGTNNLEKAGIITAEAAADFFTLGLAEVALTPAEAASKAGLHTVLFCYDQNQRLALLKDGGIDKMVNPAAINGYGRSMPPDSQMHQSSPATSSATSISHPD